MQKTFAALIAVQALHSIEEYRGRLYDVFAPARFVSAAISSDRARGFVIFNIALVGFGMGCLLWPGLRERLEHGDHRRNPRPRAPAFAWFWVALECLNGIGHPAWSLAQLEYTPGVATAPVLLILALLLARLLLQQDPTGRTA